MEARGKVIVGADLIRFLAAVLVMGFHLGYLAWQKPTSIAYQLSGGTVRNEWAVDVFWFGYLGVPIFFVLSGFVIAFSVSDDARDFVRRRALRLLPAAWICAPIALVAALSLTDIGLAEGALLTAKSMVFWPFEPWIDGVFWTLPLEIAFYVAVAACIAWFGKAKVPALLLLLAGGSALNWAVRFGVKVSGGSFTVMSQEPWNLLLATHGCFFALGGLMYFYLGVERRLIWLAGGALAFATSLASVGASTVGDAARLGNSLLAIAPVSVFVFSVAALALSVLFNRRISATVGSNWPRTLGIMTYPLYLVHNSVGGATLRLASGLPAPVALALAMTASLVMAWLIASWLEPRLRKRISRYFDRWGVNDRRQAALSGRTYVQDVDA